MVEGPEEFDKPEALGLREKIKQDRFVGRFVLLSLASESLADVCDWQKIDCALRIGLVVFASPAPPDSSRSQNGLRRATERRKGS